MLWRRPIAWFPIGLTMLLGCGQSSPTAPPVIAPNPVLTPAPRVETSGTDQIFMILPRTLSDEARIWSQASRLAAGNWKVVFDTLGLNEDDTTTTQSELISLALQRGASALVVVPEDPEELGPALAEARRLGVPAVSILEPIPTEGDPIPVVVRASYDEPARALVQAVKHDLQAMGLPIDNPSILLVNPDGTDADARQVALEQALNEAGFPLAGGAAVRFDGTQSGAGKTLQAARAEEPRALSVFVTENAGFMQAVQARDRLSADDRFVLAGFVDDRRGLNLVSMSFVSAVVDCSDFRVATQALRTAIELSRGMLEPPDRIEVDLPIKRAPDLPSRGRLNMDPEDYFDELMAERFRRTPPDGAEPEDDEELEPETKPSDP